MALVAAVTPLPWGRRQSAAGAAAPCPAGCGPVQQRQPPYAATRCVQVLGFLVPPGAGERGVPLQTLFGFERVHVKAGGSATVWLYPALTDFAIADLDGHRAPLPGQYTVRFGVKEAAAHGMGFAEVVLTAKAGDLPQVEAA